MPRKTGITEIDRETYKFILAYKKAHNGNSPSMREIVENTGQSSTSTVAYTLSKLESLGYIRWDGGKRSIEVVGWEYKKVSQ